MQQKQTVVVLKDDHRHKLCLTSCAEQLAKENGKTLLLPLFVSSTDFEKVTTKGRPRKPVPPGQVLSWLSQDKDGSAETPNIEANGSGSDPHTNLDARLSDVLHQTADSLLYVGESLHVILILDSQDIDCRNSFVLLAGALKRLQMWHNAWITVLRLDRDLSDLGTKLVSFLHLDAVDAGEDMDCGLTGWSGPVLLKDKVNDKCSVTQGFCLECDDWEELLQQKTSLLRHKQQNLQTKGKKLRSFSKSKAPQTAPSPQPEAVCGRGIEVLQPIDLTTVPTMLLDAWTLSLKSHKSLRNAAIMFYGNNQSSQENSQQFGLLARLRVYPNRRHIPTCGWLDWLNTKAWKDRVINSFHDLHDFKEKEITREAQFLYFIIHSLPMEDLSKEGSWRAKAKVLLSPHEVNGALVNLLKRQIAMSNKNPPSDLDADLEEHQLGELPVFQLDDLRAIQKTDDPNKATTLLQSLSKKCQTLQDYASKTGPVEHIPTSQDLTSSEQEEDSSLSLASVPEYKVLQSWEALQRKFQSYPSLDNIPVPSPVPAKPKSCPTSPGGFHYQDILQLLRPDGTLDLALPPGAKKMEGSKLCRVDSQSDVNVPWPDSQYLNYHDVYYYRDENDLRLEKRYAKIRDQGFFDETRSSFVSPVKKKTGHRPLVNLSPVRRSPRKRPASALLARSKSETFHPSVSRRPSPNEATFKQPSARPLTKSPRKRPSMGLEPSSSTPLVQPLHRRLSFNLPSDTEVSPIVRRSPRKLSSTPLTSGTRGIQLSSTPLTSSTRGIGLSDRKPSIPLPESEERQSMTQNESQQRVPRKRLLSPSDYGAQSDTSLSGESFSEHPSASSTPDPQRDKSPRKQTAKRAALTPARSKTSKAQQSSGSDRSAVNSSHSGTETKPGQMKRSDRHKMKLQAIIYQSLEEKGVPRSDPLHAACAKNLFNVSIVLLKTLPNSKNLKEEMKSVVYSQVQQIINLEKRRSGISL